MGLLAAVTAITPALLLLWFFSARDRYATDGEAVWTAFAMGAVVVIPTAFAVSLFIPILEGIADPHLYSAAVAFLGAAIPEEMAKLLVLVFFAIRHEDFQRPVDVFILAIAVSLGFAMLENLAYIAEAPDWQATAIIRAFLAVPSHAADGVIMGFFAARVLLDRITLSANAVLMLLAPILLHGFYDYPLFVMERLSIEPRSLTGSSAVGFIGLFIGVVVVEAGLAMIVIRQMFRADSMAQDVVSKKRQEPETGVSNRRAAILAWVWLGLGGILSSIGGVLVIGWLAGGVIGQFAETRLEVPATFLVAIAVFPLLFGVAMFRHGIRSLNRL